MTFHKYQHIEKLGTTEVEGILEGTCHVFPKIDGTNSTVWYEEAAVEAAPYKIHCASRRRVITPGEKDNHGFAAFVNDPHNTSAQRIRRFFGDWPGLRLHGEWLIPHSLKTYREEAWRRFYVFDVVFMSPTFDGESIPCHLSYDEYQPKMEDAGIDYIPCMAVIENALTYDFNKLLPQNTFMMQEGCSGEGIVIKNYDFKNRYGRTTWAKVVAAEFKEKHNRAMGPPIKTGELTVELRIANEFVTKAMVDKVRANIEAEKGDWSSRYIPRLLNTVFYDLVREETWDFIKKHKNPVIDFKKLTKLVSARVKELIPEVF